MLTVTSYVLLMAIVFVATWMFFPRPEFYLIDVYRGLVSRAPAGTHFNSDGTVSVPGLTEAPGPSRPEKSVQPPTQSPGSTKQQQTTPKAEGGKDQNVPRK
jgi:hypothetical protein